MVAAATPAIVARKFRRSIAVLLYAFFVIASEAKQSRPKGGDSAEIASLRSQ
jgi:hypothetical protein